MKVPSFIEPYAELIKLLLAIALGCALLFAWQRVASWREGSIQNEARGRKIEATAGITSDGDKADADRARVTGAVAAGRQQYNDDYEQAKSHDQATRDRAASPVPAGVRNAFRARRIARERSGCAGEQCRQGPAPDTAPER